MRELPPPRRGLLLLVVLFLEVLSKNIMPARLGADWKAERGGRIGRGRVVAVVTPASKARFGVRRPVEMGVTAPPVLRAELRAVMALRLGEEVEEDWWAGGS